MTGKMATGALFIILVMLFQAPWQTRANAQSLLETPFPAELESADSPLVKDTDCTDDAMLVFDGSTSMGNPGYKEEIPRIVEARKAMRRMLPEITRVRKLGLIVFGPGSNDSCHSVDYRLPPAIGNAAQIIDELEKLEPDGSTPFTLAVENAASLLNYKSKPAVVVLITDGDETCGGQPCRMAVELLKRAKAITIHVIGFKGRYRFRKFPATETGIRTYTQARCLADTTGGKFITAETVDELAAALKDTLGCPSVTSAH